MEVHQMDPVTALYMEQPDGYNSTMRQNIMFANWSGLYMGWSNLRDAETFTQNSRYQWDLKQSSADRCIYVKDAIPSFLSIAAANVDDLIIAANVNDKMQEVKHQLQSQVVQDERCEWTSLLCIGIMIKYDQGSKTIKMHQKQY